MTAFVYLIVVGSNQDKTKDTKRCKNAVGLEFRGFQQWIAEVIRGPLFFLLNDVHFGLLNYGAFASLLFLFLLAKMCLRVRMLVVL